MTRSLSIEGHDQTAIFLRREGEKLHKRSLETVDRYALKMIKRAREYAPIRRGHLEDSIGVISREKEGRRVAVEWGVRQEMLGPGYQRDGVRYDAKMETGEGWSNLGPRSVIKADRYDVGKAYLTRALWDYEGELIEELDRLAGKMG